VESRSRIMGNNVIHKAESTYLIAMPLEPDDRATANDNMHKILIKFGHLVSEICSQTDPLTDPHTDGGVIIIVTLTRCWCISES